MSLAMEWRDCGVRVNALSPGYTLTPMNQRPEVAAQSCSLWVVCTTSSGLP